MKLLLIDANDMRRWIGRQVGPQVHVAPIALLGLAAWARRANPSCDVRVVESSLHLAEEGSLEALLSEFQPDLVGIRSIKFFRGEVERLLEICEAASPGLPVLVGGPIATAEGEALFQQLPRLRYAATGEGEATIGALVRGVRMEEAPGVLSRGPLGIRKNPEAPNLTTLDELPLPAYDLIDLSEYERHLSYAYNHRRQGVLITSRGCPYRCTYCFQLTSTRFRMQSAERVYGDMVAMAEEHGIRDFYFVDDIFNLSRPRAEAVFRRLRDEKLGFRLYFVNGLRVDRCDEALVDLMVEAGTVWTAFGLESAHPRVASYIKKDIDLDHAARVIAHTQRTGIVVNVNTMFGFPTETPEEAQVTLDWLGKLPLPSVLPYHFNLRGYPGCEIVEQAVEAGWDREGFLATGMSAYNDLPPGSPTFSRRAMMEHLLQYHERFGYGSPENVRTAGKTLRRAGYTDEDLRDLFTVLMNRPVQDLGALLDG